MRHEGIDPAPERGKRATWERFLRSHGDAIAAADLFTVEVLTLHDLVRYHVLLVMCLATRRVEIAGVVHEPNGPWMEQVGRNLLDAVDGFLRDARYVILDGDPVFTSAFRVTGARGRTGLFR